MPKTRRSGYWLFFHIVFVYITVSFLWWSYLLHRNNRDNFNEVVSRAAFQYRQSGGSPDQFESSQVYKDVFANFRRTQLMLYGEGIVFLFLIALGFWRIRKTFREEIQLTRQQNNFLLSITHELKSPIASLKLSMQTIKKRQLDMERIQHISDMALDDIDRLESLVENILIANNIDSANYQINPEWMDVSALLEKICSRVFEKHGALRRINLNITPDLHIHGDSLSISSVIYNLLENAIKYSREGDTISVTLQVEGSALNLIVSDTGIGIPDHEKENIFRRFYRIGTEETRSTKGTGLGLFIVKHIVGMHGGSITVRDNIPKGAIFTVTLPMET